MTATTINDAEIAKFAAMAEEWWDPKGKVEPLHKFNPVRLGYISENLLSHFGRDSSVSHGDRNNGAGRRLSAFKRISRVFAVQA